MKHEGIFDNLLTIIVLLVIAALLIGLNLFTSIELKNALHGDNESTDIQIETTYDDPVEKYTDGKIVEFQAACPECGQITWGINGDIVCRNEACPNYGIAIPVDSQD